MSVFAILPGEWYVKDGVEVLLGVCSDKLLRREQLRYSFYIPHSGTSLTKIENNTQGWDWKPEPQWVKPTEDSNRFVACRYRKNSGSLFLKGGRFICMSDGNSHHAYVVEDNDGNLIYAYACEIKEQL